MNAPWMKDFKRLRPGAMFLCIFMPFVASCNKRAEEAQRDSPRLTSNVTMIDVTFHSAALKRDMQYRVVLPVNLGASRKLPVVYLLHGGGGGFRDWSNYSDVARLAERGLLLIMPEGHSSYFTNAAERPQDRYEDYIVKELISDVEAKFPAATGRSNRAIVGVSMGGFGAIKLALRHPELFAFAGGLSAALDVPSRPFSIKRLEQWRRHRAIFGPWDGQTQKDNDPFVLAQSAEPAKTPYLFLTCGGQEGLLAVNRKFAALLEQRHFQYEFHAAPGDHNWTQWNERLSSLFQSLSEHFPPSS
jgi:putative tributyrin esterase